MRSVITYQKATLTDVNRIARARNDMSLESPYVNQTTVDSEATFFREQANGKDKFFMLAINSDNKIAGMLAIKPNPEKPKELLLWRIGVLNEFKGRGIATDMIRYIQDAYRGSSEYSGIGLTVAVSNERAYQLYLSLGFANMGKVFESDHESYKMLYLLG